MNSADKLTSPVNESSSIQLKNNAEQRVFFKTSKSGLNDDVMEKPNESNSLNASPKKTRNLGLKSIDDVENSQNNRVGKLGSIHNRSDSHHPSVIKNVIVEKKNIVLTRDFLTGLEIPNLETEKLERKLGRHIFYFELKKGSTEWR